MQNTTNSLTLTQTVETNYETMYSRLSDDLRERMIKAVDQMLEKGDGLNAVRPYLFAALLPKEEELPASLDKLLLR